MKTQKTKTALLIGMLGCMLLAASDWLMIWGDTAYEGSLAWLTVGVAQIPAWRNSLALALSFPAVACYAAALFQVRHLIPGEKDSRIYTALTAFGMTPWMALHLFYIMILYLFRWMTAGGYGDLAISACEALFGHFTWLIPVAQAVMVLPFLWWLILGCRKKTVYPGWMAINSPLVWYVVLKLLTSLLPDCAFRLAFTNGLMSEAMLIWFLLLLLVKPGKA